MALEMGLTNHCGGTLRQPGGLWNISVSLDCSVDQLLVKVDGSIRGSTRIILEGRFSPSFVEQMTARTGTPHSFVSFMQLISEAVDLNNLHNTSEIKDAHTSPLTLQVLTKAEMTPPSIGPPAVTPTIDACESDLLQKRFLLLTHDRGKAHGGKVFYPLALSAVSIGQASHKYSSSGPPWPIFPDQRGHQLESFRQRRGVNTGWFTSGTSSVPQPSSTFPISRSDVLNVGRERREGESTRTASIVSPENMARRMGSHQATHYLSEYLNEDKHCMQQEKLKKDVQALTSALRESQREIEVVEQRAEQRFNTVEKILREVSLDKLRLTRQVRDLEETLSVALSRDGSVAGSAHSRSRSPSLCSRCSRGSQRAAPHRSDRHLREGQRSPAASKRAFSAGNVMDAGPSSHIERDLLENRGTGGLRRGRQFGNTNGTKRNAAIPGAGFRQQLFGSTSSARENGRQSRQGRSVDVVPIRFETSTRRDGSGSSLRRHSGGKVSSTVVRPTLTSQLRASQHSPSPTRLPQSPIRSAPQRQVPQRYINARSSAAANDRARGRNHPTSPLRTNQARGTARSPSGGTADGDGRGQRNLQESSNPGGGSHRRADSGRGGVLQTKEKRRQEFKTDLGEQIQRLMDTHRGGSTTTNDENVHSQTDNVECCPAAVLQSVDGYPNPEISKVEQASILAELVRRETLRQAFLLRDNRDERGQGQPAAQTEKPATPPLHHPVTRETSTSSLIGEGNLRWPTPRLLSTSQPAWTNAPIKLNTSDAPKLTTVIREPTRVTNESSRSPGNAHALTNWRTWSHQPAPLAPREPTLDSIVSAEMVPRAPPSVNRCKMSDIDKKLDVLQTFLRNTKKTG
eukprot:GHVN01078885.1.p1 GENE.GHVN01078885.1~~GHVN01078885.1.p1  ORF type:complete len:855 (+),score=76.34 GHVN01078885.1:153-2717(+)